MSSIQYQAQPSKGVTPITPQTDNSQKEIQEKHKINKINFIEKYGLKLAVPAYYVQSARFVPKSDKLYFVWENHNFPQDIKVFNLDYNSTEKVRDQDYEDTMKSLKSVLSLWSESNGVIEKIREVKLQKMYKGFFKFSSSGKRVAVAGEFSNEIFIYDSTDINKLMDDLLENKCLIKYLNNRFKVLKKLSFSVDDTIFCCGYEKSLAFYKIDNQDSNVPIQIMKIPSGYCEIITYRLEATGLDAIVGCRRNDAKNVDVFHMSNPTPFRSIRYEKYKKGFHFLAKISKDHKQVFLNTGYESILLRGDKQDILRWFKQKQVVKICSYDDGFLCLTCKDYDIEIDVLHTNKEDFLSHFPRKQTPGLNRFLDIQINNSRVKVASNRDDEFFLEVLDLKLNKVTLSYRNIYYKNYNFQWPYFAFITQNKHILIQNAFKPNKMLKLSVPQHDKTQYDHEETICNLDITYNLNLFYLTKQENEYRLYLLDMDHFKASQVPLFKYKTTDVNNLSPYQIYIRSSTSKESMDYNLETVAIMQHKNEIYIWNDEKRLQKLAVINNMTELKSNDDCIYYFKVDKENIIKRLTISYLSYEVVDTYRDNEPKNTIKAFEVNTNGQIYILTRQKDKIESNYFLKIYNIETDEVLYNIFVKQKDLIGQMVSGYFYIINDIMYFQNQIIKINMNNIEGTGEKYKPGIFQSYNHVIDTNAGQSIPYLCPIATFKYKRVLYLVRDVKRFTFKQGIVIPFLDERKLYFNSKDKIPQFCCFFDDPSNKENPRAIMSLSPVDTKMLIYSLKGVLLKYKDYKDFGVRFGEPIAISHSGINMVFRNDLELRYHIVIFTMDGPIYQNTFDLIQEFEDNFRLRSFFPDFSPGMKDPHSYFKVDVQLNDQLDLLIQIQKHVQQIDVNEDGIFANNKIDIVARNFAKRLVQGANLDEDEEEQIDDGVKVYIFLKGMRNGFQHIYPKQIFSTVDTFKNAKNIVKHRLGQSQIVLWSWTQIYYYDIGRKILKKVGFTIPESESENSFIKYVDTSGVTDNRAVITMQQTEDLDEVIIWSLNENDCEVDSFDILPNAEIIFDKEGNDYIIDGQNLTPIHMGVRMQQFKFNLNDFDKKILYQGIDKGYRVDENQMEYLVIRNYLAIPYCYFNLIFQDKNKGNDFDDKNFDLDGFCYLIDYQCELHQLVLRYENLEFVLKKFKQYNPVLLQQIMFTDKTRNTPLHVAIKNKSNRSINILLNIWANLNLNNSYNCRDIFFHLLDFHSFMGYLNVSFFQTLQMKSIQTMKMSSDTGSLVLAHSNCYLDDAFNKKVPKSENSNIPVEIKGLDVWWIFNKDEGFEFLIKLSQSSDVGFVTAESTKIIIEFMWKHYSQRIFIFVGIPYLAYFCLFLLLVFYNENYLQESTDEKYQFDKYEYGASIVIIGSNLLFIAYFAYILIRRIRFLKGSILSNLWGWLDLISLSLNITIMVLLLIQQQIAIIRRLEAIAVILMWLKFLYFLRIIPQTAPFVRNFQEIISDIKSFLLIFFLAIFAMANGYFLIGQNQMQYDKDVIEKNDWEIPYDSIRKSLLYVYLTTTGQFKYDFYASGKDEDTLWVFLFITTIFLTIVMLNLLVAIMGSTFERVEKTAEGSMIRERLQLIMENQFLPQISNLKQTKYLIQIKTVVEENTQDLLINSIGKKISTALSSIKEIRKQLNAKK